MEGPKAPMLVQSPPAMVSFLQQVLCRDEELCL